MENVFAARSKQVHESNWQRPASGVNEAWANDFEGGTRICSILDDISKQYFGESPEALPATVCSIAQVFMSSLDVELAQAPAFLPEATVYFRSPDTVRRAVSAELSRLEASSREAARRIALDARPTFVVSACYFHKGLLIESHCVPSLTRAIAVRASRHTSGNGCHMLDIAWLTGLLHARGLAVTEIQ